MIDKLAALFDAIEAALERAEAAVVGEAARLEFRAIFVIGVWTGPGVRTARLCVRIADRARAVAARAKHQIVACFQAFDAINTTSSRCRTLGFAL